MSSRKEKKIINEFGKKVKIALIEKDKTQNWLIEQVKEKTGMYFDTSYISKIFNDKNQPEKIVKAIEEILELEDEQTQEQRPSEAS